jgi:hypothetical protein
VVGLDCSANQKFPSSDELAAHTFVLVIQRFGHIAVWHLAFSTWLQVLWFHLFFF